MKTKVENPSLSLILFGCFGGMVFVIVFTILSFLLRGLLVYYYFDWFITPVTEWQLQGIVHALGFSAAWSYIVNGPKVDDELSRQFEGKTDEEKTKISLGYFAKYFTMYALAFLFGYIFHLLM